MEWATQLSPLLSNKAAQVYNKLLPKEALDYEHLEVALLIRYDFTEHRYQENFHEARPENHESLSNSYFD